MNGYFKLVNREGASSLRLFPPRGEGKPVDITDVLEYLTMKDYVCDLGPVINIWLVFSTINMKSVIAGE